MSSYKELQDALDQAAYELLLAHRKQKAEERDRLNEEIDRYDDQIAQMELRQQAA